MPEVFRIYGFSFFFYSREHEPLHIHVEGHDGKAKYSLIDGEFVLENVYNIKKNDLKRIEAIINERKKHIINTWNKYFGKEYDDEN